MRVVAVLVAYNRRDLLQVALDALHAQTRPLDGLVVIDNASTDDSASVARDHPARPTVISLARNTGGAGGFAAGLAWAVTSGEADLVWAMDDDTIPTPTALAELLAARAAYPGAVTLLGSRAVWIDGRPHPMNTPRPRPYVSLLNARRAASAGAIPVRSSSFVSLLVDAAAIRRYGLPRAAYFIWNDDFEFTARLLRHGVGLYVPSSVVEHRTAKFGAADADPGERFFFEVRNKLWLFTRSDAFGPLDWLTYAASSLRRWLRTVAKSADRPLLMRSFVKALAAGVEPLPDTTTVMADLGPISDTIAWLEAGAA